MQVKSIYRYAKISAFKAREVTREIQGMPAMDALLQLKFIPKKAAPLIYKTLKVRLLMQGKITIFVQRCLSSKKLSLERRLL